MKIKILVYYNELHISPIYLNLYFYHVLWEDQIISLRMFRNKRLKEKIYMMHFLQRP